MTDLRQDRKERFSGLVEKVMPYFNIKENVLDLGGTILFGGVYDFLGNFAIDNPIPNLVSGAGTVGGIYFVGKQIESEKGNVDCSRYDRGMTKSLLIACAATALRFYVKEHTDTSDYFIDLFENTLRYAACFVVPLVLYVKYILPEDKGDRGGGDGNNPFDDPDPEEPDEITPDEKPKDDSHPDDFMPEKIKDRMSSRLPEPSRN